MITVALATKNAGKVREIRAIIAPAGVDLVEPDPSWIPPPEDAETYRENALVKAASLLEVMAVPCLADDSGIEVDALDGEPGPRSARFAGELASDEDNLAKLIDVVRRTPVTRRGARYRCVAVLLHPSGTSQVAEGTVEGILVAEPAGSGGFGYDPIFVPAGHRRTMAELTPVEKDAISHRGKAFRALIGPLRALP